MYWGVLSLVYLGSSPSMWAAPHLQELNTGGLFILAPDNRSENLRNSVKSVD